jgi:hypothetical protein
MKKIIHTTAFETWIEEDGIIRTRARVGAIIDINEAKENSQAVSELARDLTCPLMVDIRNVKIITKEARHHFSIKDRETRINSMALVIHSNISKMIGNIFITFNKPSVATRLFVNEKNALKWLSQFNQESNG